MLTRDQKAKQIEEICENLKKSNSVVFTSFRKVSISEMENIRKTLKSSNMSLQVVKSQLLKRALAKEKLELTEEQLSLPLAVAYNFGDEIELAKKIADLNKQVNEFEIVAGVFEGDIVDSSTIKELATLPGRDELYAKLVGTVAAPMSRLVRALNYPGSAITSVLKQRLEQIS